MLQRLPKTFSTGMFSWFPLYIPLRVPVRVGAGDTIEIQLWRCCDDSRVCMCNHFENIILRFRVIIIMMFRCSVNVQVWYEWALLQPQTSHIHNSMGASSAIGL